MTDLVRDVTWGHDRMFVAFDPETKEILANSPTIGASGTDEGIAAKAAKLGKKYVIHEFPAINRESIEECDHGS